MGIAAETMEQINDQVFSALPIRLKNKNSMANFFLQHVGLNSF